MKRGTLLTLFVMAFLISSCASKQDIGPNGYSVSYSEGYSDGCASGKRNGIINDDDRFDSEEQYALGWSDGFRSCETAQELHERQGRSNNLQKGVAAAHNEYFESYRIGQQPSTRVTPGFF